MSSVEPDIPYNPNPRPQLHFSGLDRLWGCGEQFRFIYIEKLRQDATVSMAVGTAVDKAVNANLENKILGVTMPMEEIKAIARDSLETEWTHSSIVFNADEKTAGEDSTRGTAVDKAVRLAVLHARDIAPRIRPTHVQRRWSMEIPGFPFDLVGTIDVQEGAECVRDTKTSGKTPAGNIADMSMQLSMYALAVKVLDGAPPKTVGLDYLIDNKTPVAKTFMSTRSNDDFRVLMNRIENAADVIQKGAFTPAQPTDWRCTAAWCGFFGMCRYAQKPKSVFISGE